LYVLVTKWKKQIILPQVKADKVELLGYEGNVRFSRKGNSLIITAPQLDPNNNPSPYAWAYKLSNVF